MICLEDAIKIIGVLYLSAEVAAQNPTTPTTTPSYPRGPPPKVFPTPLSDIPIQDFRCWSSHVSWTSASASIFYAESSDQRIYTSEYSVTTEYGNYVQVRPTPDITLCDGVPRVTGRATPTGWAEKKVRTSSTRWYSTWYPPTPTCTVDDFGSVCSKMQVSMTSIVSRIRSAGFSTDFPLDEGEGITEVLRPPCQTLDAYPTAPTPVTCSLDDKKLIYKVLYWPPEVITEQPCSGTNISAQASVTPTPTRKERVSTASYGSLTFTSPTVYYILENAYMLTYAGMTNGNRTSAYRPLNPSAPTPPPIHLSQDPLLTPLSTITPRCANQGRGPCTNILESFALQNLLTVPADTYFKRIGGAPPIYQGWYTPKYTFPRDLRTGAEVEKWRTGCDRIVDGAVEPTFLALPTEEYGWINEGWTWGGASTASTTAM